MRKPIKLWLQALRSGKYKQGQDHLKQGDKYCCLGVAIDVYNKCHKSKVRFPACTDEGETLATNLNTIRVQKWLKLNSGSGLIKDESEDLAGMNDVGDSFKQIAQFIEKNIVDLVEE